MDEGQALYEWQAGFRKKRTCIDNVYTLNEIVQSRLREGKKTYAFFLDVQKAYDTVWRNGLWVKLWDLGVKGTYIGCGELSKGCMKHLGVWCC